MTILSIAGVNGTTEIELSVLKPMFILGRNGTGKSALVHALMQQLSDRAVYLPGNRSAVFEGEGLAMTPSGRRQFITNLPSWDSSPDTRWRIVMGNQRNEKAIHDLTMAEAQYKMDYANTISKGGTETETAVRQLQARESPLDKVNLILEQANLPVRMLVDVGELKARQNENIYSFAKMSDGERIALVLIAEVVAAKDGAAFLIDEPELHLHRAIVVPLVSALVKMRPKCEFIISTHELDLPAEVPDATTLIVRSASWSATGTIVSWDFDVIDNVSTIPESLRTDILGSRRKILFIEGTDTSLDGPIYAVLFPGVSIRSKGSCGEVVKAVAGLKATVEVHRAEAYGLIDNDGMSSNQVAEYQVSGVYALSVFAVESLYYAPELMQALALRQAETACANPEKHTELMQTYLDEAKAKAVAAVQQGNRMEQLASRVAERQLRDSLIRALPTRAALGSGNTASVAICLPNPYSTELARLRALVEAQDLDTILARYRVRDKEVLGAIAKALKFPGRADYELAALARLSSDKILLKTMQIKLMPLCKELMCNHLPPESSTIPS